MRHYSLAVCIFTFVSFSFVRAQTPTEFKGHDGAVHSVAISDDGTLLATASVDDTARIWNYANGKTIHILKGHNGPVRTVALSKGAEYIATGGSDATIRLWNPKTGKALKEFAEAHKGGVTCVTFSPDGQTFASTGADMSVKLWNINGEIKNLGAHKATGYNVAFNHDGSMLASCGNDGVIKVWDVKAKSEFKSMQVELPKPEVKEEPKEEPKKDDKDKKKKDMGKKEGPKEDRKAFHAVVFTPDSKQVISAGSDGFIRFWDLESGKESKHIGPAKHWLMGLAVSKDGKMFAAAGYGGTLRVYDMESGNMLFNLDRDYWVTFAVAFAPDGTALITAHDKGFKAGANVARITPLAK